MLFDFHLAFMTHEVFKNQLVLDFFFFSNFNVFSRLKMNLLKFLMIFLNVYDENKPKNRYLW
jgi:hypothetical protein